VKVKQLASAGGLKELLKPRRKTIAAVAALSLVTGLMEAGLLVAILQVAITLSSKAAPSALKVGPLDVPYPSIPTLLAVSFALAVGRIVVALWVSWKSARLTAEVQRDLRITTFDAYIDADWPVQAEEPEGHLNQILSLEVERVTICVFMFASGLSAGCTLVMLLISAIVVRPSAALALVIAVAGLFALLRPLTQLGRRWATMRSSEELGISQSVNELVRTAEEIRVHGVADAEKWRLTQETETVARWTRRIQFLSLAMSQVYQGTALLLLVLALLVVYEVGATDLAGLGAIVLILLRSFAYSQQVQSAYHLVVATLPSIDQVQQHRLQYRQHPATSGSAQLDAITSVALSEVSYAYRPGRPALDRVSLEIGRGEAVGVVGPSGAGKSTLVQILLRLRQPDEGTYLINGEKAGEFSRDDWARLVSYVPQDPKLLAGTVADNIRFLRHSYSDQQVEAAARLANLHDEIMSWPSGYGTVIGQRADAISGGQRQRLCLARALLGSPQLLVLDEPTSALDAQSEQIIQETLTGLRGSTTVFIIAHRLSTLSVCGRILVLNGGQVEAFGTSESLGRQDGFYRRVAEILAPRQE
jgi:ABC-type multidrug transport system fused ATPase/permease subunit